MKGRAQLPMRALLRRTASRAEAQLAGAMRVVSMEVSVGGVIGLLAHDVVRPGSGKPDGAADPTLSGLSGRIRTLTRMHRAHRTSIGLAGIVLLIVLVAVPSALAASAVDQYSEG